MRNACCQFAQCLHADSKLELLAGRHTGDLEIQYEQGDLVYASLTGECAEVDVQLSQEVVSFQTTYVNTHSQRCFRSGFCCVIADAATRPTVTWHSTMPANNLCICCLCTSFWCSKYIYE